MADFFDGNPPCLPLAGPSSMHIQVIEDLMGLVSGCRKRDPSILLCGTGVKDRICIWRFSWKVQLCSYTLSLVLT